MPNQEYKVYTYEEIDEYVKRYKANKNDTEAVEKLIEAFNGVFLNLTNLIKTGEFDIRNKIVRNFISLFIKDKSKRARVHAYHRFKIMPAYMRTTATMIKTRFESLSYEDVYNECILCLLEMLDRYESYDGKPRFHLYVSKAFHYKLFSRLRNYTKDPVEANKELNIPLDELEKFTDYEISHDNGLFREFKRYYETYANDIVDEIEDNNQADLIDEQWIFGVTCSEVFECLTPTERYILKLKYIDKLTDVEIAEKLNITKTMASKKRRQAENKLKQELIKYSIYDASIGTNKQFDNIKTIGELIG